MLPAPRALLLDFGGVIVESTKSEEAETFPQLVKRVKQLIGPLLSEEEIASELRRGNAVRQEYRARTLQEPGHEQLWREFITDLWPEDARDKVLAHATELTYLWANRPGWRVVEGIAELLDHTLGQGLPVAVVSNTRCGQAHRDALERLGFTGAVAFQIYSDEVGFCKPHPELIAEACRLLDVPPKWCWMVGDKGKDVDCARRAGAGAAVYLGQSPPAGQEPDATVADGHKLLKLLRSAASATQ